MKWKTNFYILLLIGSLHACQQPDTRPDGPPNVVLIMTDDQGWGDLQMHQNDSLETPVLDKFAAESTTFDRFYVSPVCAPTRASLLTGRYHLRTGCTWVTHRKEAMRPEEFTMAEFFKNAGYATGIFGKWHNGEQYPSDPIGQGFQEFFGFSAGHWNNYFDTKLQHNQEEVETSGYITDVLTNKAIDFIDRHQEQPFFCYIPYNAPHSPMQVPDRYFIKYKGKGLTDFNSAAYGMVDNLDENIGRLLKTLESKGLKQNTIVLFTTDNGPNGNRYNGGMKGHKGSFDEGGVRVPLFIRFPAGDLEAGYQVKELAAHIDLLPTLAGLCGLALPEGLPLDGQDLTPLLKKEVDNWPERTLFTFPVGNQLQPYPGAVRNNTYRLVLGRDSSVSLYNMLEDPGQKQNIAEQQEDMASELKELYLDQFKEVTQLGTKPLAIPIGYAESPRVRLPAPAAKLKGNLNFLFPPGWANDWAYGWQSVRDQMAWDIEVVSAGQYEISVQYACPPESVGSLLSLNGKEEELEWKIETAHQAEYLPSPDWVERWEVYEKEWKLDTIGRMDLAKGQQRLTLKAQRLTSAKKLEVKALWVKKL